MARINPSGSDGNFSGVVRLKSTKIKGREILVTATAQCGDPKCKAITELRLRPGAVVNFWKCQKCKQMVGSSDTFVAASPN